MRHPDWSRKQPFESGERSSVSLLKLLALINLSIALYTVSQPFLNKTNIPRFDFLGVSAILRTLVPLQLSVALLPRFKFSHVYVDNVHFFKIFQISIFQILRKLWDRQFALALRC